MKTRLMRKIDYFVGIPICLLFSFLHNISNLVLKKNRSIKDPKRILFIKFFGLGTIVLASPAIKKCREMYSNAEFYFLTFAENRELLSLLNVTDNISVFTISTKTFFGFARDVVKTAYKLQKLHLDVVIDFEFFSRFTSILAFMIRAKCRVGFYNHFIEGLYRGNFLTHKVLYNHYQHTSVAFLDMIETMRVGDELPYNKMGYSTLPYLEDQGIMFRRTREEADKCRKKFGLAASDRLVLLNPNISEGFIDLRMWPLSHFAQLSRTLLDEHEDMKIGIIAPPQNIPVADELASLINSERVVNFAGQTTLAELCMLLDLSCVMVTNDSGPAHLAALTGTHVITMFGPDTPVLFRPLTKRSSELFLNLGCSPCGTIYNGKQTVCRDNQCMKRITPEMVGKIIVTEIKCTPAPCANQMI
jgi:ADP-heptose:LPS heptosyltransferase